MPHALVQGTRDNGVTAERWYSTGAIYLFMTFYTFVVFCVVKSAFYTFEPSIFNQLICAWSRCERVASGLILPSPFKCADLLHRLL